MAQFTRVNGDFYPVLNLDAMEYSNPGVNATSDDKTVQPQGPKLEFFKIVMADIAANTTVAFQSINTIQQLATIYIYEFNDAATDELHLAVYPVGAWTTVTLAAAIDAATGGTSTVTGTATFTN
jgi:hypothetical protein